MLITSLAAIASRCPVCSKPDAHSFSFFSISNSSDILCTCGFHKLTIGTNGYRDFCLQIPCQYCGSEHYFQILIKDFIKSGLLTFTCPLSDYEIAFIGKQDKIAELFPDMGEQDVQADKLAAEHGYDEYFLSPDIMLSLLNILCQLSENRKISCECGEIGISIGVFEEKISLTCEGCGASISFQAIEENDIEKIKNIECIRIAKKPFRRLLKLARIKRENGD